MRYDECIFIIGNTAITPGLESGTILEGVTRDSTMVLLKEMGFQVEERNLGIDEIMDAYRTTSLKKCLEPVPPQRSL